MRIAFYCNLMGWPKKSGGGVRQWVLALANGLVARGHTVDVLTEAPPAKFRDEPRLDPRIGRVVLGRRGPRATRRLRDYLLESGDVRLVAALNDFNLTAARLKPRVGARAQIMLTQHENLSGDRVWRKKLKYWLLGRAVRRDFRRADSVVCVSHGVADDLREQFGVPAALLHTIYNPAFSEDFVRGMDAPVEHAWLRDKTVPVVIAVGRLHPVKGFDDLLRAFARLLERRDARLIILGEGRSRADLEAQVARDGLTDKVALPGRVENVAAWMARSDLFALTSHAEGFGNALVEGLAAGLRIVATRCPSGPAEILEDGRWGTLVPVGDPQAFADAMDRALSAPSPDREAQLARARAFSLDAALDQYLALWSQAPRG
ncbi:glycosyltransferase [Solimonas marina]|uniref:Glycosyltransferase n=1 Tax=Solimonas marina TaxID=2714601 RepID=A0A969WA56_9GAMM|nr:glycosyltransferase [Solimonas marina]NKF23606.1 glycosyltransferase [Solimonas marina]